jgi:hypothetical protein
VQLRKNVVTHFSQNKFAGTLARVREPSYSVANVLLRSSQMTRTNRAPIFAAAMMALAMMPPAFAAPVTIDQSLLDKEFELDGMDYNNTTDLSVDAATVQNDPAGVNKESGNDNIQENKSEFVPSAETDLLQSLINNKFNTNPAGLSNPTMRNEVNLDVSSSDEITANVGVNAASGAFNLQVNASVTAAAGDLLAQSAADIQQDAQLNTNLLQDTVNVVVSNIDVDEVTANVGINAVSGVGNAQANSFTVTTPY